MPNYLKVDKFLEIEIFQDWIRNKFKNLSRLLEMKLNR